jgi:hypothetical protein
MSGRHLPHIAQQNLTESRICRGADYQVNALPMIHVALHRLVWLGLADVEGHQGIAEVPKR